MWNFVTQHFTDFSQNIELSDEQHIDAIKKAYNIANSLYKNYWGDNFDPNCILFVGSYGKKTAIRTNTDVDLLFLLPWTKYYQYDNYTYNGQSALLQEVKGVLQNTFPRTEIKGNGQVVQVEYQSYKFEVVPAFLYNNDFLICDANNGGMWKITSPRTEFALLNNADNLSCGSARMLIKYFKIWKHMKNIDLKSFAIEISVCNFINEYPYLYSAVQHGNPIYWHDWMVRDYFYYLSQSNFVTVPLTEDLIEIDLNSRKEAYTAFQKASVACNYERLDLSVNALQLWEEIFGNQFRKFAYLNNLYLLANNIGNV